MRYFLVFGLALSGLINSPAWAGQNPRVPPTPATPPSASTPTEVPTATLREDIHYAKASAEINAAAQKQLEILFTTTETTKFTDFFDSNGIVCGPGLWDAIQAAGRQKTLAGKPIKIIIPLPNKDLETEGRSFFDKDQVASFWNTTKDVIQSNKAPQIRAAQPAEIEYFWATIPFDIEEPLLIAEINNFKLLVNFQVIEGQPKIFWLDIVQDLAALSKEPSKVKPWQEFSSPEGNFIVLAPGPSQNSEPENTEDKGLAATNNHLIQFVDEQANNYLVGYADYPQEGFSDQEQKQIFTGLKGVYVENFKGKLRNETDLTLDEFNGRGATIDIPEQGVFHFRVYWVGKRMYQLMVMTKNPAQQESAKQFLESFKLLNVKRKGY